MLFLFERYAGKGLVVISRDGSVVLIHASEVDPLDPRFIRDVESSLAR